MKSSDITVNLQTSDPATNNVNTSENCTIIENNVQNEAAEGTSEKQNHANLPDRTRTNNPEMSGKGPHRNKRAAYKAANERIASWTKPQNKK